MKIARWVLLFALLAAALAAWPTLRWLKSTYDIPENYAELEPGLWMGGNTEEPPPGTRAVLNLCEFDDGYRTEAYRWEPIRDAAPAPSLEWLKEMVAWVETQRDASKPTFVHCFNGASRSGLVTTAYLMKRHGWSRDEAIARIAEKRPQIRPNPAFMTLLAEWERE